MYAIGPIVALAVACVSFASSLSKEPDYATACYSASLPALTQDHGNRTIPWGSPDFEMSNGTVCCTSLEQVRAGIDAVDRQLLSLLAQRAAYVREATRFKPMVDKVDVPSRDAAVVRDAIAAANSTHPSLPKTIARAVFDAIINSSVPFEKCVFEQY